MHNHRDESGASAVEYGLIAVAVAALVAATVFTFGLATDASYDESCRHLSSRMGGTC